MKENIVVIALLRPGYTDEKGNHFEGDSGKQDGDNWNDRNTDTIANTIENLKHLFKVEKGIVAGHSGGTAITANILGRNPYLIDTALLVSCPCGYVNKWRESMLKLTGIPVFNSKIKSLSPIKQIKGISDQVLIIIMTRAKDKVTLLKVAQQYQAAALKTSKNVTLIRLPGRPHNNFLYSKVFVELKKNYPCKKAVNMKNIRCYMKHYRHK